MCCRGHGRGIACASVVCHFAFAFAVAVAVEAPPWRVHSVDRYTPDAHSVGRFALAPFRPSVIFIVRQETNLVKHKVEKYLRLITDRSDRRSSTHGASGSRRPSAISSL